MTRSEFKQTGIEMFAERFPKVKKAEMREYLSSFLYELEEMGLELYDDETSDDDELEDLED